MAPFDKNDHWPPSDNPTVVGPFWPAPADPGTPTPSDPGEQLDHHVRAYIHDRFRRHWNRYVQRVYPNYDIEGALIVAADQPTYWQQGVVQVGTRDGLALYRCDCTMGRADAIMHATENQLPRFTRWGGDGWTAEVTGTSAVVWIKP